MANTKTWIDPDSLNAASEARGVYLLSPSTNLADEPGASTPPTSTTSALTSVAASVSGVALLAANSARKAAYIYNDSTAIMYLGLVAHGSVSATEYTVQVAAQGFYELPTSPIYQGEISAVWASANGNARLTELT